MAMLVAAMAAVGAIFGSIQTATTDALAPPARLPVAMAALGAGGPVGTAIGQIVTGVLVDGPGLGAAWLAPVSCACVALLVALLSRSPA